jgi:uncharacterized zinc-type alcohol dehydrogenase-like protein
MPPLPAKAYAASSPTSPLAPLAINRRAPTTSDVAIDILYCGVCHSDLHIARNEWGMTKYPCVPGHEILGRVTAIGSSVKKFKVGDLAAVGCLVDSCRTCSSCTRGLEQFCLNNAIFTYNGEDKHLGGHTYGGYCESIVVDEAFTLKVPANLDPAGAAPLLCAGITTYSPLKKWKIGKGTKAGVVGLGGLGHMGVKFAAALGAETVLFTTSQSKVADGKRLGAHEVIISKDADDMAKHAGSFDFILDTVSADHDINALMGMLKLDGTLCLVGAPPNPLQLSAFSMLFPRRQIAGSLIGGLPETQEMLDFCGAPATSPNSTSKPITCDIELIGIQQINEAYERMLRSDVKYRFVIDMASLKR